MIILFYLWLTLNMSVLWSLVYSVDGGWTKYGDWTVCTASCGGGTQTRNRTCNNPAPSNGGTGCVGKAEESKTCNIDSCPGIRWNLIKCIICMHIILLWALISMQTWLIRAWGLNVGWKGSLFWVMSYLFVSIITKTLPLTKINILVLTSTPVM